MNIGENIRRIRMSQKMTQGELAQHLQISQAMLCQLERGTKILSLPLGKEIADALGCQLNDLIV